MSDGSWLVWDENLVLFENGMIAPTDSGILEFRVCEGTLVDRSSDRSKPLRRMAGVYSVTVLIKTFN